MVHSKFIFQLLAFVLLCAIGGADIVTGNGQPGCKTQEELNVRFYRNNWDPTRYWDCVKLNEPAISVRCPDQTGFLESVKKCVDWEDWIWEVPVAPPSEPN